MALGVGQHHPARTVGAAQVIHGAGAEAQQPGEFLVASAGGGDEVKVQPVLDLLDLGNLMNRIRWEPSGEKIMHWSSPGWSGSFGSWTKPSTWPQNTDCA